MKNTFFFFSLLVMGFGLMACNNDKEDDPSPAGELLTEQNVRAVFNFLPPTGYESTFYTENLPGSVLAGYNNTTSDQNIAVSATENLSGAVIDANQQTVENSFFMPVNIQESTVNGFKVYQSMEQSEYRVVIFNGQYQFDVLVQNDPDPTEAAAEAELFITLITEAMTTF